MSPRMSPRPATGPAARPTTGPAARRSAPRARIGPDDLRRTFEAVPARTSAEGEPFAASWWGRAWVDALETLSMDEARLARGRAYADDGQVAAITVTPGRVVAYVHGSRARPCRAELRLRTFADPGWEALLDAVAARPGHLSALLAKEMPHSLARARPRKPVSGCCPPPTTSTPAAPAPTTGGPASTSPPSASRRRCCWTATRSSCY